jgi:hypothetical protein
MRREYRSTSGQNRIRRFSRIDLALRDPPLSCRANKEKYQSNQHALHMRPSSLRVSVSFALDASIVAQCSLEVGALNLRGGPRSVRIRGRGFILLLWLIFELLLRAQSAGNVARRIQSWDPQVRGIYVWSMAGMVPPRLADGRLVT